MHGMRALTLIFEIIVLYIFMIRNSELKAPIQPFSSIPCIPWLKETQ